MLNQATNTIIKAVQKEAFKEEFDVMAHGTCKNDNGRDSVEVGKRCSRSQVCTS